MRAKRQQRILAMIFIFLLVGTAMAIRLFSIQVLKGSEYARAAVVQRSLRFVYATGRGGILDRHGQSLIDTRWEPALVTFDPMLDRDTRQVLAADYTAEKRGIVHVIRDPALIRNLQERNLSGFTPVECEVRYGDALLAPHVTGYIKRDEAVRERPTYREPVYTAINGLELYFNDYLAAPRPATLAAVVDAQSRLVPGIGYRDWQEENPRRPYNVVTTIDRSIQAEVERIGSGSLNKGAIIVVEPKNGDILAMASFPAYSPQKLFGGINSGELSEMDFLHRTLKAYEPGSVFKVVLAAAAVEKGLSNHKYTCSGVIAIGEKDKKYCANRQAHGELDLKMALAHSCNGYFIELGQRLGRETVLEYAARFGLGQAVGITLYGESPGRLPSLDELPWLGDLANTCIGQYLVLTTPLQLARLMNIIANDGRDIAPRLVTRITDKRGATVRFFPVQPGTRVISAYTATILKEMLQEVTLSGTARKAASLLYTTAGKSGTAEVENKDEKYHRWFAGFAHLEKPLVIVVFSEESKGKSPAEIFRETAEAVLPLRR